MLSGKEKDFLNKKYPLVSPIMILFLIPALALAIIFVIVCSEGQLGTFHGLGVTVISAVIFILSFSLFLFFLYHRHKVRKKCIAITNTLAIRAERNYFDSRSYRKIYQFSKDMAVYDVVGMVTKILNSFSVVPRKKDLPMLFITIKELEEMYLEQPDRSTCALFRFKARGMKKDQWGEVVWSGFRSRARKSLLYEVAFMVLGLSKARYEQEKRHEIIRKSDVEYLLEAEK